jgi:hypothetical protein
LPQPNFGGPRGQGGRGGGRGWGGPGGGGHREASTDLDPLISTNDTAKPLLSKLLEVPALRTRYLGYVRDIAVTWLNWNKVAPFVQQCQELIQDDVKADTRKIYSTEAFLNGIGADNKPEAAGGGDRQSATLRGFIEKRRAYLLNHPEVRKAGS